MKKSIKQMIVLFLLAMIGLPIFAVECPMQSAPPSGGKFSELAVEAKQATTVQVFTEFKQKVFDLSGWTKVDGLKFRYNDGGKTQMQVYERKLKKSEKLDIPQGNWAGCMLLLPADAVRTK